MALRIICTLFVFLLVLSGGIWVMHHRPLTIQQKPISSTPPSAQQEKPKWLFYNSIGDNPPQKLVSDFEQSNPTQRLYTLEVKIVKDLNVAQRTVDQLQKKGVEAYYTPLQNNGQVIYRIRVGAFVNKNSADLKSSALLKNRQIKSKVIRML